MPYSAFLPVGSPLEGENGSWGHRRHEFGASCDFLVDQNGALGQNCPVQRRETVNKRNEQHLKNRIPCRMAKDSFHATPSLFWCFSRLMGIQPGGGAHATGFFPLLNQLKEAGTTCGEQLLTNQAGRRWIGAWVRKARARVRCRQPPADSLAKCGARHCSDHTPKAKRPTDGAFLFKQSAEDQGVLCLCSLPPSRAYPLGGTVQYVEVQSISSSTCWNGN